MDSLEHYIRRHKLDRVAAHITESVRDCIRLKTQSAHDMTIAPAASKLGGRPDLPATVEWPRWHSSPLSFIAQINTRDLPNVKSEVELPHDVLLSFFYEPKQSTWGFDPKDWGSWSVIASNLDTQLERREFPADLEEDARFQACTLLAKKSFSLPDPNSERIEKWGMSSEEGDAYLELYEELMPGEDVGFNHQILGYASQIQNDMELECQLVSNGIYCGDSSGYASPQAKALETGASEWRLLIQIDSDDDAGMMWGDAGRLYFWMREPDLRARNFDRAWMILQCY